MVMQASHLKQDLINLAYKALEYKPTNDKTVINDRLNALAKLEEEDLLNIVKNCIKAKR